MISCADGLHFNFSILQNISKQRAVYKKIICSISHSSQNAFSMMHDRFGSVTIILLKWFKETGFFRIEHFVYVALFGGFHILHVFCTIYVNIF